MLEELNSLFNRIQERLTAAFNLVSDEALNLALLMIANKKKSLSPTGLTAEWSKEDALALANHFYWLAKTYQRDGQQGRYICFHRAAKVIYGAINADEGFNGKTFLTHEHIGAKCRLEAYSVWLGNGYTERVQGLIDEGKVDPYYPAPMTVWKG